MQVVPRAIAIGYHLFGQQIGQCCAKFFPLVASRHFPQGRLQHLKEASSSHRKTKWQSASYFKPFLTNLFREHTPHSANHMMERVQQFVTHFWPIDRVSRAIPVGLEVLVCREQNHLKHHRLLTPRHRNGIHLVGQKFEYVV